MNEYFTHRDWLPIVQNRPAFPPASAHLHLLSWIILPRLYFPRKLPIWYLMTRYPSFSRVWLPYQPRDRIRVSRNNCCRVLLDRSIRREESCLAESESHREAVNPSWKLRNRPIDGWIPVIPASTDRSNTDRNATHTHTHILAGIHSAMGNRQCIQPQVSFFVLVWWCTRVSTWWAESVRSCSHNGDRSDARNSLSWVDKWPADAEILRLCCSRSVQATETDRPFELSNLARKSLRLSRLRPRLFTKIGNETWAFLQISLGILHMPRIVK